MSESALCGIRVLDASAGIAGPYAAHLLALAGADVVKLEPMNGEWGRFIGRKVENHSLSFTTFNRGKRALAIDLKSTQGQTLAARVARGCDIVIESFRPGVIDRLGLGYPALSAGRPDLVYLSISGFGAYGPQAGRPALDTAIQAQAGWLSLNRGADGAPVLMDYVPIDVLTGLYASQAAIAALLARFRFGAGRHVEVSLLEAASAFLAPKLAEAALLAPMEAPATSIPTGIFAASTGAIAMAIKDDREFAQLAMALGRPEWSTDPRLATRAARSENRDLCESLLGAVIATRDAAHWDTLLAQAGIVAARIRAMSEMAGDAQLAALGAIVWDEQHGIGRMPRVAVPGLPAAHVSPAPRIGEHSRAILSEAGIEGPAIDRAIAEGIVADRGASL